MPAPTPDLARNFRATAWMWFRVCRGCDELNADDYLFRAGVAPRPWFDTPASRIETIELLMDPGWIIDADGNSHEVAPIISTETAFELLNWSGPENAGLPERLGNGAESRDGRQNRL